MLFSVTPIYALLGAVIYLVLWMRVSAVRADLAVSVGDGGNPELLLRSRQHGNCAEWSGFVLTLMILAEGMGTDAIYLHASGALLILGRLTHPLGLKIDTAAHPLRYVGNGTNMLAAVIAMFCIAFRLAVN